MGGTQTKPESLSGLLPLLGRLTGSEPVPFEAPFWPQLFEGFDVASASAESGSSLAALQKHGMRFFAANLHSGNLQRLCLHAAQALLRARDSANDAEASEEEKSAAMAAAVLRLRVCRVFLQYFIEHLKQDVLALHLSGWPEDEGLRAETFDMPEIGKGVPRALMKSLVQFLAGSKVSDLGYDLYEEALTLLLVLFSAQMFNTSVQDPSLFLDMMLEEGEYFGASEFVSAMFHNIKARRLRPLRVGEVHGDASQNASGQQQQQRRGFLSQLARYGSAVFLFPIRAIEWILTSGPAHGVPAIADYSTLLLLLIGNCRRSSHFADAFTLAHDPQQSASIAQPLPAHAFEEDFSRLFDAFSARLDHDPHVLLFYFMLHRNAYFKQFVLSRTDLDVLLLPLLRHLYDMTGREAINPQQIYIILIILLMLSQREEFGSSCERLRLAEVPFYKEHVLLDVSLADLIAIVLVRTVTLNLSRLQDGYLHTNCLAILANLSPSLSHLHAHAAQRLFAMLLFLHKRLSQAQGLAVVGASADDPVLHIVVENRFGGGADEDVSGMIALFENLMSILLEVFDAMIGGPSIARNTAFIYAALHSREHILFLSTQARWAAPVAPLVSLVQHFEPLLDNEPKTMDEVMATIERGVINWKSTPSAKGVLRFSYTEEPNAGETFFLPYTLSLVYTHAGTRFDHSRITMFCKDDWNEPAGNLIDDPLNLTIDT